MGRCRSARAEALRLAKCQSDSKLRTEVAYDEVNFSFEHFGVDGSARIDDQVCLGGLRVRRKRQLRPSAAANQIRDPKCPTFLQADDFQVCHLTSEPAKQGPQTIDHTREQWIDWKFGRRCEMCACVEPSQFGLSLRVGVVVDIEQLAAERSLLVE